MPRSKSTPRKGLRQTRRTTEHPRAAAGNFHGCFVEPGTCVTGNPLNRKMTFIEWAADMTVGKCRNLAIAKKFRFAGLQFGELCYGSNDVSTYQSEGVCDVACAGSSFEFCGGANCATSIYHTGYNGARQACCSTAWPARWMPLTSLKLWSCR